MSEKDIFYIDANNVYFKPDIVFDINKMSFVPNKHGSLSIGYEFTKGLYSVGLVRLGDALKPVCNTLNERVDLDVIQLGLA